MTGQALAATGLALLIFLLEPLISLYWVLTSLIVWIAVQAGLRAGVGLHGQIRDERLRRRLRREIAAADAYRGIGAAELVRPGRPLSSAEGTVMLPRNGASRGLGGTPGP